MKLSRYNILKNYDGTNVFFNSRTCTLAIVNDEFMKIIRDLNNDCYDEKKYDPNLVSEMKRTGCLVEDDVDELMSIEFRRNLQKYSVKTLALTIAPTMDCNFRCIYCFEHHVKGVMSTNTQDSLIKFIGERLPSLEKLTITWFGGEPLLAKNIVYSLSSRILTLCKSHNVKYGSFIITNLSLFDENDIDKFKDSHINGIQVTIDGPEEIHEKRRIRIDGEGSFKSIIHNINLLQRAHIKVGVRINIDNSNIAYVEELLKVLKEQVPLYQELQISYGKVIPYTDICKSVEDICFDDQKYSYERLKLCKSAFNYGFKGSLMAAYPIVKYNACSADYVNSFVIDAEGFLYKCWNRIGIKDESCGNVSSNIKYSSIKYLKWVQWNPINYDKCKNCNLLPVCAGGCPYLAMSKEQVPVCDVFKYHIDEMLEFYYRVKSGLKINKGK